MHRRMQMPQSRIATTLVCLIATALALGAVFGRTASSESVAHPQGALAAADQSAQTRVGEAYGKLPISFVANEGQTDARVKFMARGLGYSLYLTQTGAVMVSTRQKGSRAADSKLAASKSAAPKPSGAPPRPSPTQPAKKTSRVLRIEFVGASDKARVTGLDELPGKVNYLVGDASRWRTELSTFARVQYREVYPGIDLVYYGNQSQLEYDFLVSPGAKPEAIKLQFTGADKLKINDQGDLLLALAGEVVTMRKPFVYQAADDGARREVPGRYVLKGDGLVAFEVKKFDQSRTLVIDPVIAYSTGVGSGRFDYSLGVAVDSAGNAYITGSTDGSNFPTTAGSFDAENPYSDSEAFVTKLNASGTALVYSTYLGGSSTETAYGIDVDSSGNAYITGRTNSADYPTVNAVKGLAGNFLKTSDGGAHWAGKNVGSPPGSIQVLAVDPLNPNTVYAAGDWGESGGIYKSVDGGNTWSALNTGLNRAVCIALVLNPKTPSTLYAALNSYDSNQHGVYKSTDGGNTWSSVSSGLDTQVYALAIDPKTPTTLYAGGYFSLYKSTDGGASWKPSSNGLTYSGFTAIVVNPLTPTTVYVSAGGGGVFKSTNGGASWAQFNTGLTNRTVRSMAINPAAPATVYAGTAGGGVFKSTNSGGSWAAVNTGLPTYIQVESLALAPAAPATLYLGSGNGRVYKSDSAGGSWSQVYGTLGTTTINALAVDPADAGKVYAAAFTHPGESLRDYEVFVSKLNASGSALVYSTFLGGEDDDFGYAIAVDSVGGAYVTGNTASPNFPLVNAIQTTLEGGQDVFVTKFNPSGTLAYSTFLGGDNYDTGYGIAVDSSGYAYLTGQTSSGDFPSANPIPDTAGGVFVSKVSRTGNALVYSTLLGGETGHAIAVDASGSAYVTGSAGAEFKTTPGAFQTTHQGGYDAFLAKLTPAGSGLAYATLLGGNRDDYGRGVALDGSGNAYVAGYSDSEDYPLTPGSLRTKSPLFKSTDGGANWGNLNHGLRGELVQALALDPQNPSTLYAGTRTGTYKSTDGGGSWREVNSGQAVAIAVDPVTPHTVYMAGDSSAGSGVYKSTDGGGSWTLVRSGLSYYGVTTSLVIDPATPSTLYMANGGRVNKSVDGGATWKQFSSTSSPNYAMSISVSPAQPATVYVAAHMSPGGVFKSTNGGATWQRLGSTQLGAGAWVAASPADAAVVFASADGGLFKSTNGGTSWVKSHASAGKVFFDPVNPSNVYLLQLWDGLLKSTDGGATWSPINKGLMYDGLHTLVVNPARPSTVYVGSQVYPSSEDIFVTKLRATGGGLAYSTLLGPGQGFGIAVDSKNNAYVTGTAGAGLPVTPDSYQPFNLGYEDAFVTKLGTSYSVKGQALNADGTPLAGVEITLAGAQLRSALTEGDGSYLFENLPAGSSFKVSAAKAPYSFSPASQSFTGLAGDKTVNFKAAAATTPFYTISGRVTNGGEAVAGAEVKLSGSQTRLSTTDAAGNYSLVVPGGGSYTVTPAALGFSFNPASKSFSGLGSDQTADFAAARRGFVVTNTNDHGAGSLWQAILDANATPGPDVITFKIPGTGVKTIVGRVALPDITDAVVIDGTTQPGFAGTPIVVLDGSMASAGSGLSLRAGNCTIRGLVIQSFKGLGIRMEGGGGNIIEGNYIGLDAAGKAQKPNGVGVGVYNSSNNRIGGTAAAARNVISGNERGISISNSTGNVVLGNFIGTDPAGAAALGNGRGVEIHTYNPDHPAEGNLIGGTTPGAGNLISGNSLGIDIVGAGNTVQGNLIGTDATGLKKIANEIGVQAEAAKTVIGGTAPGARNVISGNTWGGVSLGGAGSTLQGNFIGTDITGLAALGNGGNGVTAGGQALIGGTTPEARNIISANGGFGNVVLGDNNSGDGATVRGNYIGTDLTGNVALSNPGNGITLFSGGHVIGGTTPASRNVISGNKVGIQVGGSTTSEVNENVVQGNYIGLNASGNGPLPNLLGGVGLSEASKNIIGGAQDAARNVIAFNGGAGISVSSGAGNLISRNRIFSNAGLGIDSGAVGPNPNDAGDTDQGANSLQNSPVLTSVAGGSSTTVQGTLKSRPGTTYAVDFYSNTACDASGHGEGALFFGTKSVVTDAGGNAAINVTFAKPLPAGKTITATATDPDGNTSEFSPCDAGATTGSVGFSGPAFNVLEDVGGATVTVVRTGGSRGPLTVKYATSDATAEAGADYTAAAGTLVFADGETIKTFTIPVADDGVAESEENVLLTLSGLTDLETMGAYSTSVLNIKGNDTQLGLLSEDVTVVEGNAGMRDAVVTVRLSAQTGRTVTVDYSTAASGYDSAVSGTDFQPVSGTLTFGPGVTSQTVAVPVIGDTVDELNESFWVALSNATNAAILNFPRVFILDDEPDSEITITDARVAEGNSGQQTSATFTVKLSRPSAFNVNVQYRLEGGTAAYDDFPVYAGGRVYFAPGQTSQTVTVPVYGDALDEPDETFFVNLYNPYNAAISDGQAVCTIVDNDPTGIRIEDVAVTEGNAGPVNATFKVMLTAPSAKTVTVNYATANGTAAAPTDYTAASGTLTFAPGQTALNVTVPVAGDLADEPDEDFRVLLSAPTNAVLAVKQATCTVADNDAQPAIKINSVSVTEGNAGTTNAAFNVTLSAASGRTVTVYYQTADSTAVASADYTTVPATPLTFAPGQTSKTVNVAVKGDAVDEPDAETFKVVLSGPDNATIGASQGTGTITDDDAPPSFSVSDAAVTEGDSGTTKVTFTVTLAGQTARNVSVKYATSNGTAVAPSDYAAKPLTALSFVPGVNAREVTVYVNGDTLDEPDETFNLTLSAATYATIADGTGVVTIADNDGASAQAAKSDQSASAPDATSAVEFAEAAYSVGEGDGRLEVTVRRSGDLSSALALDYATTDGTGTDRSDYRTALGRLSFSPGEETKSFAILITDDAYAEGEETLRLTLSLAEGATDSAAISNAEVRIADNDEADGALNPVEDALFFVRQQFVDILGRDPEAEELFTLVKKLNECQPGDSSCGRAALSAGLLLSDEYQSKAQLIHGVYRASLGRAPQYREFVREMGRLAEAEQSNREAEGPDRQSFRRRYVEKWLEESEVWGLKTRRTNREFVSTLVSNSGLAPETVPGLLGGLSRKEKTRADILADLAVNARHKERWANEAQVLSHYFTFLRRDPEEQGFGHWLKEVEKAGDGGLTNLVSGFVNSDEYRRRFGRP